MAERHAPAEPIAALNRIPLIESGEPLIDLREAMPEVRLLRPYIVPFLRESLVPMLRKAVKHLRHNYSIGIREAWRSKERQKFIYDKYFSELREQHPTWSYATLRRQTNRFFAPYDQKAPPGHSTGGAVDVWLLDAQGNPIDLHGHGKKFDHSATLSPDVPPVVLEGRLMLFEAMVCAGFSNCRDEWWHYSYGDAAWAVRTGRDSCFYGYIEPRKEEYEGKDRLFFDESLSPAVDALAGAESIASPEE